ncbi:SDR family oxidoreductase [Streptomyces sp. NBC_01476]|uniref:SDR family oxidoreductase n=1 Tax=Streptomyces sp. NBC_01476 TaxID=2903881 RepID=UPI002E31113B|nr:SDR family oxidoreductase [Streptomyces sp. NBC_01476]
MKINGSVALVTGGNRGIGEQFVKSLLDAGASKVYASARDPKKVSVPGAVPLRLDITDPESVRAAAEQAQDVTLLINNAGIDTGASTVAGDLADFQREFDTHVFGTLRVSRAFAPVLARNGGGGILNVLSVLSWYAAPNSGGYSAAKAAEWSLTNSLRLSLADQGTQVTGLHVGYVDTDLAAHVDAPKNDPADVVAAALEGLEAGLHEVLADDLSRRVKAALAAGPEVLYPQIAGH